jgi:hypothetical protein
MWCFGDIEKIVLGYNLSEYSEEKVIAWLINLNNFHQIKKINRQKKIFILINIIYDNKVSFCQIRQYIITSERTLWNRPWRITSFPFSFIVKHRKTLIIKRSFITKIHSWLFINPCFYSATQTVCPLALFDGHGLGAIRELTQT